MYHLSDDTTHEAFFVEEVLESIFETRSIRNETIIIKSDNAPTHYKNRWAFSTYQTLADKYNLRIIRIYGAAGHGKGLVDSMSGFGVKTVLRRDIVTRDVWFANSEEICEHLRMRGSKHMAYHVVDPEKVDQKRMSKKDLVIKDCMRHHLFVYNPRNDNVLMREFLCDCTACLQFDFQNCIHDSATDAGDSSEHESEKECMLDEDEADYCKKMYDFIDAPSFVACVSCSTSEPVYIVNVEEKGIADEELSDVYGHVIPPGGMYLKGKYLTLERSRNMRKKQFALTEYGVICSPDEVFEAFVEIDNGYCLEKDVYDSLISRAISI